MGQNGTLTSTFDGTLHGQYGEDCMAGDLVGFKTVGNKALIYLATAEVGAGQVEALGVSPRDVLAGDFENIRADVWRLILTSDLIADELASLKGGEILYLSDTTPGAATRTAPTDEGALVQRVGISYIDTAARRGVAASEAANAWLVRIEPGTVVPEAAP